MEALPAPDVAAQAEGDVDAADGSRSQLHMPEQQVAFAAAHGLAAAEKEYLAHQIAALRISLAKRDADVARLEGEGACVCQNLPCQPCVRWHRSRVSRGWVWGPTMHAAYVRLTDCCLCPLQVPSLRQSHSSLMQASQLQQQPLATPHG